jgi:hypothetical protein
VVALGNKDVLIAGYGLVVRGAERLRGSLSCARSSAGEKRRGTSGLAEARGGGSAACGRCRSDRDFGRRGIAAALNVKTTTMTRSEQKTD